MGLGLGVKIGSTMVLTLGYGVGFTGVGVEFITVKGGEDFFEVVGAEETVGGTGVGVAVGDAVGGTVAGGEVGGTGIAVGGDYVVVVGGTSGVPVVGPGTSGASFGADGEQHGAWIFWIA